MRRTGDQRKLTLTVKGEVMARLTKLSRPGLYSISARNISSKGYIGESLV